MDFLIEAFSFDWKQTLIDFLRVKLAFALAIPNWLGTPQIRAKYGFADFSDCGDGGVRFYADCQKRGGRER